MYKCRSTSEVPSVYQVLQPIFVLRWVYFEEKGEKNNKYFLGLEANNRAKKTMNKQQRADGTMTEDQSEIMDMQKEFYQSLYSNADCVSNDDMEYYLEQVATPTLTPEEQAICEGELTVEECRKILKAFKDNKSPGNDGITVEFYKKFWPWFGEILVASLNESLRRGELSSSQKQAVITLLDKGKDRTQIKNWRPISLLNVDAKIASKALAARLTDLLPRLIHKNQVGYVKKRNIQENVRTLLDIMHYTKEKEIPGLLICVDFQKAFDSVSWNFLNLVLKKFNFGPSFIKWINTLYRGASSCIINNGETSQYFPLERGVRQGDLWGKKRAKNHHIQFCLPL